MAEQTPEMASMETENNENAAPRDELAELERQLDQDPDLQKAQHQMPTTLTMAQVQQLLAEQRAAIMTDVHHAINVLWNKLEPLIAGQSSKIEDQSRSIANLIESLDELELDRKDLNKEISLEHLYIGQGGPPSPKPKPDLIPRDGEQAPLGSVAAQVQPNGVQPQLGQQVGSAPVPVANNQVQPNVVQPQLGQQVVHVPVPPQGGVQGAQVPIPPQVGAHFAQGLPFGGGHGRQNRPPRGKGNGRVQFLMRMLEREVGRKRGWEPNHGYDGASSSGYGKRGGWSNGGAGPGRGSGNGRGRGGGGGGQAGGASCSY